MLYELKLKCIINIKRYLFTVVFRWSAEILEVYTSSLIKWLNTKVLRICCNLV